MKREVVKRSMPYFYNENGKMKKYVYCSLCLSGPFKAEEETILFIKKGSENTPVNYCRKCAIAHGRESELRPISELDSLVFGKITDVKQNKKVESKSEINKVEDRPEVKKRIKIVEQKEELIEESYSDINFIEDDNISGFVDDIDNIPRFSNDIVEEDIIENGIAEFSIEGEDIDVKEEIISKVEDIIDIGIDPEIEIEDETKAEDEEIEDEIEDEIETALESLEDVFIPSEEEIEVTIEVEVNDQDELKVVEDQDEVDKMREAFENTEIINIVPTPLAPPRENKPRKSCKGTKIVNRIQAEDGIYSFIIVKCLDGTIYTSTSADVDHSIKNMNRGKGSDYTKPKSRRPVKILYSEKIGDSKKAVERKRAWDVMTQNDKDLFLKENGKELTVRDIVIENVDNKVQDAPRPKGWMQALKAKFNLSTTHR